VYISMLGLEAHIFILLPVLSQTYQRGQSQRVDVHPSGNYHRFWRHMGELSKVANVSPGRIEMTEYRRALAARPDTSVPSIDASTLHGGEGGGGGGGAGGAHQSIADYWKHDRLTRPILRPSS